MIDVGFPSVNGHSSISPRWITLCARGLGDYTRSRGSGKVVRSRLYLALVFELGYDLLMINMFKLHKILMRAITDSEVNFVYTIEHALRVRPPSLLKNSCQLNEDLDTGIIFNVLVQSS